MEEHIQSLKLVNWITIRGRILYVCCALAVRGIRNIGVIGFLFLTENKKELQWWPWASARNNGESRNTRQDIVTLWHISGNSFFLVLLMRQKPFYPRFLVPGVIIQTVVIINHRYLISSSPKAARKIEKRKQNILVLCQFLPIWYSLLPV